MRKCLLLLVLMFSAAVAGQGIDGRFLDSLADKDLSMWKCMRAVRNVNYFLRAANIQDTIHYSRQKDGILFRYQGESLVMPCSRDQPREPAYVIFTSGHGREYSYAEIVMNSSDELRLSQQFKVVTVEVCRSYLHEDKITLAHYADDVLNDRYFEFSANGVLLVQGHYQQIDSTYLDSIPAIDPDTYEVINRVVQRKKYPKKVGHWIYRSPTRDTLRVEKYPEQY